MDIFQLTKSKTREKILRLFFADPGKKYYLRELERLLKVTVGNIRRELMILEKTSLFKHEAGGREVYYFLNQQAPFFEDIKNLVSKTIGAEGALKKELSGIRGIKRAFIFGSFAKKKERPASDIDLMIIGEVDENTLIDKISRLEKFLKREINYHLVDEREWQKKRQSDSFVKAIIKNPQIEII